MQPHNIDLRQSRAIKGLSIVFLIFLSLLILKVLIFSPWHGKESAAPATISVSGTGEVFATPDTASISFDVNKEDKTVSAAQNDVNTVITTIKAGLESKGIADADIETTNYSAYPVYVSGEGAEPMICTLPACPPLSGNQVLQGYAVDQTIQVTIRNIDSSGDIVTYLGTEGATNLSSLSFSVDNPDSEQAAARAKAIDDATAKAKVLASQLGVHLSKIVGFTEENNTPYPVLPMMATAGSAAPAATTLPSGQNEFTSNVTITYEIQ